MPAKNLQARPVWKEPITVEFVLINGDAATELTLGDAKEGSGAVIISDSDEGHKVAVLKGKTINESLTDGMPVPVKAGHTLQWKTQGEEGVEYTGETPITESVVLYNVWTLKTWDVTFDVNGGEPAPAGLTDVVDGNKISAPDPEPTWKGHRFMGWFDGEDEFDFAEDTVTKDLTLTAKWDDIVWTVEALDPNAEVTESGVEVNTTISETNVVSTTVIFNDLVQWQDFVDENDGRAQRTHLGKGWYVGVRLTPPADNSAGDSVVVDEGNYIALAPTITEHYYDYWFRFTVQDVIDALEADEPDTGFIIDIPVCVLAYGDEDEEEQKVTIKIDVKDITLKNDPELTIDEDNNIPNAIVTENGVKKTWDVTFDAAGGAFEDLDDYPGEYDAANNLLIAEVYHGNYVLEPGIDRLGYYFEGWFNGNEPFDFATETITEDTTLTAHWLKNWSVSGGVKPGVDTLVTGDGIEVENYPEPVGEDNLSGLIVISDMTTWRNQTEDETWAVGVRFTPILMKDEEGNIVKVILEDAWYEVDGAEEDPEFDIEENEYLDVWFEYTLDEIKALAANDYLDEHYVNIYEDPDDDQNPLTFKVVLDFNNIDLVNLDDDPYEQHKLVIEDGEPQVREVTFDPDNGGNVETVEVIKYNTVLQPTPDPDKENYSFAGWYITDEDGNLKEEYDFDAPVTEDLYLVANWKAVWTIETSIYKDGLDPIVAVRDQIKIDMWDEEPGIVTPGNVNGLPSVRDDVKKLVIDKAGEDAWLLKIKFTSPDDVSEATITMNGETADFEKTDDNTLTAKLYFDQEQVEEWAVATEAPVFNFVAYNKDELSIHLFFDIMN